MKRRAPDDPAQILMFGEMLPDGAGGFRVRATRLCHEVGPKAAARMLGISQRYLSQLVDQPLAQKHLRWRWISEKKGKRLFEVEGIVAYVAATKEIGD